MGRLPAIIVAGSAFGLAVIGVVMLASTSYTPDDAPAASYAILRQHCLWLAVGLAAGLAAATSDYHRLYHLHWWIFGAALVALSLCFIPAFGESVNGAARWVSLRRFGLPFAHFQPSEFAKLALIIALAAWFARQEPLIREFTGGFLVPALLTGAAVLLVGAEVDLGSAALMTAVGAGMMFVAGTRLMFLLPILAGAAGAFAAVVHLMPNRVERILAFLDLEKFRDGLGLQQWRALLAFGSGGLQGLGLGSGRQKLFTPEANTDFIFPMVGEEFGLLGTTLVVLLFAALTAAGLVISHRAPDRFGKLLAFGIVLLLGLEAILNMGVTTALLPNKGLPLPFVSYGGSSLIAAMLGVGILFNIHHQTAARAENEIPAARRRRIAPAV